jgi:hypothetical protein
MKKMWALVSLHKHWLNADALRQVYQTRVPDYDHFSKEMAEFAQMYSSFARLSVLYGLIYVVIEGYQELGCKHKVVDELLSKEEFVDALRLFRNSTFHYQKKPVSEKMLTFLNLEESEIWIRRLHSAFQQFFEETLPIEETLNEFKT